MEKAILKTLIYADIFDYPLKINEIHKWLVGRKVTVRQVEKALGELVQSEKCKLKSGYYFLPRKNGMVSKRLRKEKQSERYFKKAKMLGRILRLVPWIKLVGISGGLAVNNAGKSDDIDLFIITTKKRLWISRFLCLGFLSIVGQRRKVGESRKKIAGKFCVNILLDEDKLEQRSKDIFVAHEVLQMKVLWQRDGVYSKYLADNKWVFKFLPNWITQDKVSRIKKVSKVKKTQDIYLLYLENLAKWFQLKIMQKPTGMERIEEGALYFHPLDCRQRVLDEFKKRISILNFGPI